MVGFKVYGEQNPLEELHWLQILTRAKRCSLVKHMISHNPVH